ncbi:hypothetical protein LCGC14_1680800, partial [marine sediment metagenome]
MPREWTDEQKAEASRRAKERGFGRSPAVLIAEQEARPMEETVDRVQDEDGNPVTTTHTRPGTTIMYKPLEHGGYE